MALTVQYTSCGCNRSPFSVDWGKNDLLAYGACRAINICKPKSPTRVLKTLVGHKERVNGVRWIRNNSEPEFELVSGSTDNTARLWRETAKKDYAETAVLEGHTGSVTIATGIYGSDGNKDSCKDFPHLLVATASADSTVKIWERQAGQVKVECRQTVSFGTGFALSLAWVLLPDCKTPLLACGCDDQKVHLLTEQGGQFVPIQTLAGHEDWIRDVDFATDDSGDVLLASCSQDCYIRIWRLSPRDPDSVAATATAVQDLPADVDIHMKETTFTIKNGDKRSCYAVSLESVLSGHDNWIYSIRWQPPQKKDGLLHQPLALLSASMDKTLILWRPEVETGLWIEQVRVGDVGGNTLGFYGGVFRPEGDAILGHGYHGAFHVWEQSQDVHTWLPGVTVGGHFAGVQDLAWEPERGEFIISVSQDQTSRVHGYWQAADGEQSTWHELGRPQVHGYDVQCLTFINRWKFASGADEKVTRIFEAPRNFVENMGRLSGIDVSSALTGSPSTAEGASVPSLGLSNKAVFQDSSQKQPAEGAGVEVSANSQYPEAYFSPLTLSAPPSEDNLIQNSLWPEIQKLYGHGYEIFALACHPKETVLASACKAAQAEHAAILLWDTATWRQIGKLESHVLTITQLRFSHDGSRLLSVSRDRTWSIYREQATDQAESGPVFERVAFSDKKTSVHSRIIWSAAWTHDDKYFATVSRDKKAVLWTEDPDLPPTGCLGHYKSVSVLQDLPDSVTAVDFAPVQTCDKCYVMAAGLESGCIHVYKWLEGSPGVWSPLLLINQSEAHHLTVKRLQFRPCPGELGQGHDTTQKCMQLASCGADNFVRVYSINMESLVS